MVLTFVISEKVGLTFQNNRIGRNEVEPLQTQYVLIQV